MLYRASKTGFAVETTRYRARFQAAPEPVVHVWREGKAMFSLPALSGLASVEQGETLTDVRVAPVSQQAGEVRLTLSAHSNLWGERTFHWAFHEERIEHFHQAAGFCTPGRCYFFSNGAPGAAARGAEWQPVIHAHRTFSPAANMADEYERVLGIPQSLGILPEVETPFAYGVPDRTAMIFAPPPLCLMFGRDDQWAGVGVGVEPGGYRFNAFEYSGVSGRGGCGFFVNYLGYHSARDFVSPRAVLHFGHSPYEVLEHYVAWTDASGFATQRPFPNPAWHRLPVFCGWGEQCRVAEARGSRARDESTQANYEEWIRVLEKRGLPFGTLVIDDKWQANYGTFDVDAAKWPAMAGFISRQHAAGRRVLLWVPTYHHEAVPQELCVLRDGRAIAADVSNPAYETFLRGQIAHLVRDVGVDGFKVDWVWGITRVPQTKTHAPLHGIEWLRRFQAVLYEETHRWRPDALVETHSACPLFRESSDVLRLNDLHGGARNVALAMARRARIAHLAGWDVIDCDNASDSLEEWWSYMQAQPAIGTPSLYLLTGSANWPAIPEWMWQALAGIWREYRRDIEARYD